MVELRKITCDNFDDCIGLKVSEKQKDFVAPNIYSLAQAWAYHKTAFPFAIYHDDSLVGFIMLGYYEDKSCYTVWRLMIDERHQRKGYGKVSLRLGIQYLVEIHGAREVFLSVMPENIAAEGLYRGAGFERTGRFLDGEAVMRLKIMA